VGAVLQSVPPSDLIVSLLFIHFIYIWSVDFTFCFYLFSYYKPPCGAFNPFLIKCKRNSYCLGLLSILFHFLGDSCQLNLLLLEKNDISAPLIIDFKPKKTVRIENSKCVLYLWPLMCWKTAGQQTVLTLEICQMISIKLNNS